MIHNGKATISETLGTLSISVPSKKNWFILIFATVWLGGWYMGFTTALSRFIPADGESFSVDAFMAFWLAGWSVGGMFIILILLWGYFGKEQLLISSSEVILQKTVFGVGQKRKLSSASVSNFRHESVNDNSLFGNRWALYGLGPGKVKFDYGMKTYSFALAVDDAEANYLADYLTQKTSPRKTP